VFFYLTVFSKLLKEVRPPALRLRASRYAQGDSEKIRHCRMDPDDAPAPNPKLANARRPHAPELQLQNTHATQPAIFKHGIVARIFSWRFARYFSWLG
jgi:hypothetical protein